MRRVRRKGGSKDKVFGCDLMMHLNASSQEIPQVLRCCTEFLETHGIVDGIYRLSGVSSNIQKLRAEFEGDGSPDLNKELYLQDIHCVSSLCKAYFRELPNPLLTYQLYDKFAEAVSILLEEERLVKIRDVLRELPTPHYRTLEFLMQHLVRMASYSPETNMHSRNLAIVWAPNLLRSKDIEISGFNGKAAFIEVRVQSIVVEFILTHVPQLFPEQGVSCERRKSFSSQLAVNNQEEGFFKSASLRPVPNFGNISPGDGPLPIRPYHAIIEGTEKRKGSLKSRKWMSIFNIGGRFHDRRQKHSSKEKERTVLRPARSMDSLSTQSYRKEGSLQTTQHPPSTNNSTTSPLITPSPQSGSDLTASSSAMGCSEYAVTYRRGTGLVSGALGTQGTYTPLDPEGLGVPGNETLLSRPAGLKSKGRRAAMHITGPTMVTVPLHITSNLALGVLQGGGGDRVVHCGRDKDERDRVDSMDEGERVKRSVSRGMEWKVDDIKKVEEEVIKDGDKVTDREEDMEAGGETMVGSDGVKEGEGETEDKKKELSEEWRWKTELEVGDRGACREQRAQSQTSNNMEDEEGDDADNDFDENDEYMDMRGVKLDLQADVNQSGYDHAFDASDILNPTEEEGDELGLSGYVQDNFEFLDQMDCGVLDHMDCGVPYQVNEFSVEPPGQSDEDEEYEVMEPTQPSDRAEHDPETHAQSPNRLPSIDWHCRHTKSLSLPQMTSPVRGPEETCSEEEEEAEDDSVHNYYSSDDEDEDEESMFVKSLPTDFFLKNFSRFGPDTDSQDTDSSLDRAVHHLHVSGDRDHHTMSQEFPERTEQTEGDQEQEEVRGKENEDGSGPNELEKVNEEDEANQGEDQLQDDRHSKATADDGGVVDKEQPPSPEAWTHCCDDPPSLRSSDESVTEADRHAEEKKDVFDDPHGDYPPCPGLPCVPQREIPDAPLEEPTQLSVSSTEQDRTCVGADLNNRDSNEGEDMKTFEAMEDMCPEMVPEKTETDESKWEEESRDEGNEVRADLKHEEEEEKEEEKEEEEEEEEDIQECGEEPDIVICRTNSAIWAEFEAVICEVFEEEERKQGDEKGARENVTREEEKIEYVPAGEQIEKFSREETEEAVEWRMESLEESLEGPDLKLTDTGMQEKESPLQKTSERAEGIQGMPSIDDEEQHHGRKEEDSKAKETNDQDRGDELQIKQPAVDPVRSDLKELKEGRKFEESIISQGGVGRRLVVCKHPKIYQVTAVAVVPPKPQHCRITTLTLRQQHPQQQHRESREADRWEENSPEGPTETEPVCAGEQGSDGDQGSGKMEKPILKGGEKEGERRRDGEERTARDTSRSSPISMCFDEAVAIATMRREKERECDKDRQREWGNEVH